MMPPPHLIFYIQYFKHDFIINNMVVKEPVHRAGDGGGTADMGVYQCAEESH